MREIYIITFVILQVCLKSIIKRFVDRLIAASRLNLTEAIHNIKGALN